MWKNVAKNILGKSSQLNDKGAKDYDKAWAAAIDQLNFSNW